ncbi:hypothetical protein Pcinc_021218 [Petrolisthes cinctipes]|uniref:Integrase zinc-binding domain-containing protein n=1 Tax=Petrolisthes cinctipes TaxID=88211 RepID=A0AAE1FGS9_PETCI|nr:hypothetical protein Pcinc_021218 [Petrolisthes cinctipes]
MESVSTLEEVKEFIDNESITMNDVLDKNKRELVLIAQRLNIPMIASTTKDQLVPLINNKLFATPLPEVPKTESQLQLELAKVEAEAKARVEIEVRKAEVEAQAQSQAQVQIRQAELDHEFRMRDFARPMPGVGSAQGVFPACAVTRAQKKRESNDDDDQDVVHLAVTDRTMVNDPTEEASCSVDKLSPSELTQLQKDDPELMGLAESACSAEESVSKASCYYFKSGVLMRKWRPPHVSADSKWESVHQILRVAHDSSMAGHLGTRRTFLLARHIWGYYSTKYD